MRADPGPIHRPCPGTYRLWAASISILYRHGEVLDDLRQLDHIYHAAINGSITGAFQDRLRCEWRQGCDFGGPSSSEARAFAVVPRISRVAPQPYP
jgi:hypothetical protein